MSQPGRTMQIGELVRRAGVPRHTIHYYVRKGILPPPVKVGQTRALYSELHLEQLKLIKKARQTSGSPLAFVSALFDEEEQNKNKTQKTAGKKKPATPSSREASIDNEKKERIKTAAIDLFSSRGYHNTSVKEIVDRAGFSTGTFYLHFKSKKDLFNQVVAEAVKASVDRIEKVMRKEKNIYLRNVNRLKELRAHHDLFTEVLIQLRYEIFTDPGRARDNLQKVYLELSRPFIYEIRQAQKLRLIRPVDLDLLTFLMIGVCDIMLFRQSLDDRYNTDQIIAFVFDVLQEGLKLRAEPSLLLSEEFINDDLSSLTEDERAWLAILRQAGYNQAKAARMLGMTRQSVSNYLRRHPLLKQTIQKERMKSTGKP